MCGYGCGYGYRSGSGARYGYRYGYWQAGFGLEEDLWETFEAGDSEISHFGIKVHEIHEASQVNLGNK